MALTRESERWADIVRDALAEVVPAEDDVIFDVIHEAAMDMDDDAEVEHCEACDEDHPPLALFAIITVSLPNPPENPTMGFRVTKIIEAQDAQDAAELRTEVHKMWSDLMFERQAASMADIDRTG